MTAKNVHKEFHLIIAAAGRGSRFNDAIPKQYFTIQGKSILRHTLDNAMRWPGLKSIHVIINPQDAESYHKATYGLDLPPFIAGGKERSDSINKALKSLGNIKDNELVLIHDAARPFTSIKDIESLLQSLSSNRAASLACRVSDTLRKEDNNNAGEIIERDGLWALQTPQAFRYGDIKAAHEQNPAGTKHTDDTSLISTLGIETALVESSRSNIKITTPDDIMTAESFLSSKTETRTGIGFDVHAFDNENTEKPLMLCGIKIEHNRALTGHSDADVGLHAITDAVLGAIGENDIGHHFPPSDDTFKNMDSAVFLQKALELLHKKGGSIQNIDVTLICEAPKIGPHKDNMKARIAQILEIDTTRVNVKATTTEKLGFTGRGEGIAAQAIATIKVQVE